MYKTLRICLLYPMIFLHATLLPSKGCNFGKTTHREVCPELRYTSIEGALKNLRESRIILENGISVLLCSDPLLESCHVAFAVRAGSAFPLNDTHGIAHVLAHALFSHTSIGQNEIIKGMDMNAIRLSSRIAHDHTVYYFTSSVDLFSPTVDFFAATLCSPSIRSEELKQAKAEVKLEHTQRLEDDHFRIQWTREQVYSPEHPLHKCSAGKDFDLSKITTENLRSWHGKHYVGQNITLVVHSPLPIEQISSLIISAFERFPRGESGVSQEKAQLPSLYRTQEPSLLYVCTQKERKLELEWLIRSSTEEVSPESLPETLVAKLLCHKARGGLVSILRQCGFIEDMNYAVEFRESLLPTHLRLSINLTKKGTKEWSMVLSEILLGIEMLIQKAQLQDAYMEDLHARKSRYLFLQEHRPSEEVAIEYARALLKEPLSTFPESTLFQMIPQNKSALDACSERLKGLPSLVVLACSMDEWQRAHDGMQEKSAWLQVHSKQRFSNFQWLFRGLPELPKASLAKAFVPPPKNAFLNVDDLNVAPANTDKGTSDLIEISKENNAFFYCQDAIWNLPLGHWTIVLTLPDPTQCPGSAAGAELAHLCVGIFEESTRSIAYLAKEAGILLRHRLLSPKKLEITVSGPNKQTGFLVESILRGFSKLTVSEETFNLAKQRRIKFLSDRCFMHPVQLANIEMKSILFDQFSLEQRLDDLHELSFHQAMHFIEQIKQQGSAVGLYFGSLSKPHVEEWWKPVSAIKFFTNDIPASELSVENTLQEHVVYSVGAGSASSLAIDLGIYSFQNEAKQLLLAKMLDELLLQKQKSSFHETEHVSSMPMHSSNKLYMALTFAHKKSPGTLDNALKFLDECIEELLTVSPEKDHLFLKAKQAVLADLRRPVATTTAAAHLLSSRFFSEGNKLLSSNSLLKQVISLTREECSKFAKEHFLKETRQTIFLTVHGIPTEVKKRVIQDIKPDWCEFHLLKSTQQTDS